MGNINIEIPDELHKRLKIVGAIEGDNINSLVTKAIEEKVTKLEEINNG